jgi:hypothetical protein
MKVARDISHSASALTSRQERGSFTLLIQYPTHTPCLMITWRSQERKGSCSATLLRETDANTSIFNLKSKVSIAT